MNYQEAHHHQAIEDKIAREVLKHIARETGIPYKDVLADFRAGYVEPTQFFWDIMSANYPDHDYHGIYYCQSCKKFSFL